MTTLQVERNDDRVRELMWFLGVIDKASLATTDGIMPAIATIFVVHDQADVFFKSRTASHHSKNVQESPRAALAAYLEGSSYDAKFGAQLVGTVSRIRDVPMMQRCVDLYAARFAGSAAKLPSLEELCSDEVASTFYRFRIEAFKIVDEDKVQNRTMLTFVSLE